MAEAVVEDRPPPPQKFYCHLCNTEVQTVNADYTCPLCSGGFIEEIQETNEQPSEDVEMQDANRTDDLDMIRNELATLLMPITGGGGGSSSSTRSSEPDGTEDDGSSNAAGGTRRRRSHRRGLRMQNIGRFDNVLLEILQTLSVTNDASASLGNASMFFMGNPGDYAWGREGIDTIVTQLLNQMDTSGPPPLSKDKIDEIPNVDITQDQVDIKLQCSVCWEDFKLSESVRKLPCLHVYHENCIVPWLELHGTCPICRKSLSPDGSDVNSTFRNAAAFIRARTDLASPTEIEPSNILNSTNGMQQTEQQQQQQQQQQQHQQQSPNITSSLQQQRQPQSQQQQQEELHSRYASINPLSLSRLFAQPGTSSQSEPFSILSFGGPINFQESQPNFNNSTVIDSDGNTYNSNHSNNSSERTNNLNDISKNDDEIIDFEFD